MFCFGFFYLFRDNADDSIFISENAWLWLVFFFDLIVLAKIPAEDGIW